MRQKMQKGQNWVLILILLLAAVLRLYGLAKVPPSLHWDETALGYNAFSILKTARDEYGRLLPLVFKSFGDYKPGLYVYLTVPFVVVFGLTELAVRLPSALMGIATVWLLYQVTVMFFDKKQVALFSSFALAVSPWHLQFSRGAWEANVALFFILGGIGCFRRLGKNIKWLYLAALSFAAAVLTYQSGKMVVPLIVLGLLLCFKKKLKKMSKKHLLLAAVLLFFLSVPILLPVFTGGGGRLKVMSFFSYSRPQEEINQIAKEGGVSPQSFLFKLWHDEDINYLRGVLGRYFNHFSGKFLFFEGDWSSARHRVPYAGVLYYFDFIFIIAGVYWLIKQNSAQEKFIWYWLLISPLPASLSRDTIQAVRAINMLLPLMVIIGGGMDQLLVWVKTQKRLVRLAIFCLLVTVCSWNYAYYFDQYYFHFPIYSSKFWQFGYKDVVNYIYPIRNQFSKIIFTQKWGQPYIYWLFYTMYDPADYQRQAKLTESSVGDVGHVEKIDNIQFRKIYWPDDRGLKNTLFVGEHFELPRQDIDPDQAVVLEEIKFLNGETAFRLVKTL